MPKIDRLAALEILDSRGRPTLEVTCVLAGGVTATAQVPSGASTGRSEAVELRDGDPARHRGLGCRRAVANVVGAIGGAVVGRLIFSMLGVAGQNVQNSPAKIGRGNCAVWLRQKRAWPSRFAVLAAGSGA